MPAGSYRFQAGDLWCTVLSDGYVAHPASWCFPSAGDELSAALDRRGSTRDRIISPYTCLLIETGREVVLADTGLGDSAQTSGAVVARLELAGIRPRDVTTVIFTHAHPDHIGGAASASSPNEFRPVFPDARYVMAEAEWDFWTSGSVDLRGMQVSAEVKAAMRHGAGQRLRALRHQMEWIDRETEIVPGVHAIPAPGHTPGHLALLLSSQGHQLLNLGDAALHPLHLEHPAWENGFDLEPERALATRRALLERAEAEEMHVMAFHFPFPSIGRVAARAGGGWDWTPGW